MQVECSSKARSRSNRIAASCRRAVRAPVVSLSLVRLLSLNPAACLVLLATAQSFAPETARSQLSAHATLNPLSLSASRHSPLRASTVGSLPVAVFLYPHPLLPSSSKSPRSLASRLYTRSSQSSLLRTRRRNITTLFHSTTTPADCLSSPIYQSPSTFSAFYRRNGLKGL